MSWISRWAATGLCVAAACAWAASQPAQTPDGAFDSASIKPARPGQRGFSIQPLPGRLRADNVTLKMLIAEAWHVYDFQISGGEKWIDSDRFDIEAKAADNAAPSRKELRAMLQKLLEDRFALKIRRESKEMAVYELAVAKSGPKMQPPKHPELAPKFAVQQRRLVISENAPLENLVEVLTWLMGKPVLDHTGLEGSFDYKLEWTPDERQTQSTEAPPEVEGAKPPLTAALQEQLGLRLVANKDQVEILIVEHAAKPPAN